jgi:hypothetical protein
MDPLSGEDSSLGPNLWTEQDPECKEYHAQLYYSGRRFWPRTREGLPGRSPIDSSQARLTLKFFSDGLPEKKLQLVGMSILINPIKPWAEMSQ